MAEIDTSQGGGGKKKGAKKVSTKVDMTPMVDLAFLLITFFMLTTTFNTPKVMQVLMPDKTENKKEKQDESFGKCTVIVYLVFRCWVLSFGAKLIFFPFKPRKGFANIEKYVSKFT